MSTSLIGKNIQIIGITGSEGSAVFEYVQRHSPKSITAHDFIEKDILEKSFKTWHKGITEIEKEKEWSKFQNQINGITLHTKNDYLTNIQEADIVFVPQSWRLYKENTPLIELYKKNPEKFKTLTQIYLNETKALTIGVTGTVGKGSTAHLIYNLLKQVLPKNRSVVFAGNETWKTQAGKVVDSLAEKDILILEISHRQLMDGIQRAPNIAVVTNIFPNHLDEMSFDEYKKTKLSLLAKQSEKDIAILNADSPELKTVSEKLKAKVIFYSAKNKDENVHDLKEHFEEIINMKTDQFNENILAALTCCKTVGVNINTCISALKSVRQLPARLELVGEINGTKIFDDIKSTTPWGTQKGLEKLGNNTILICGGETKGINYDTLINTLTQKSIYTIALKSELAELLLGKLAKDNIELSENLESAVMRAVKITKEGGNVLISPAGAFFYSYFIKNKKGIKRIVTSLLLKQTV